MSYIIPTEEISLAEQFKMRKTAQEKAVARAATLWARAQDSLEVREADYVTDFIAPAGAAAAVGIAGWLTMPLLVIGNWYSVFADNVPAIVNPVVPQNQVWVFYKANVLELAGPDPVAGLQFRRGTSQNLIGQFDLEGINGKMVSDGYFTLPVTYENPDLVVINVECRIAIAAQARVRLGCFVVDRLQDTVV